MSCDVPPVPRAGEAAADAWLGLQALEAVELYLPAAPPPAVPPGWCQVIEPLEAGHYRCRLELEPLSTWLSRLVLYARSVDALRGVEPEEPCGWWRRLLRRCP